MLNPVTTRKQYALILITTFVSAVGSYVFFISLMAALVKANLAVAAASLVIALPRLATLLSLLGFGNRIDGYSARKVLIVCEFFAGLASVGLFWFWPSLDHDFAIFVALLCVRSVFVNIQSSSRSQLMRHFSGDDVKKNSKTAIALNQATHGAFFIAALISFLVVDLDLRWVIAADFLTFIIGGLGAIFIADTSKFATPNSHPFQFLANFYRLLPKVALADLLLSLSFCGLSVLIYKLSAGSAVMTTVLNLCYGLGVWVSGQTAHFSLLRKRHTTYWAILAITFVLLHFVIHTPPLLTGLSMILFATYWALYHRYSSLIQARAPQNLIGGIVAARNVQMLTVLIAGEFIFGQISHSFSLQNEILLRAALATLALIITFRQKNTFQYED
jgi:MFS family permease